MRKATILAACALLGLAAGALAQPKTGITAPKLNVKPLHNASLLKGIKLNALPKGKVIVLDFWAFW